MPPKLAHTTISDIAKALRTTPATVSRAINNHPSISFETKEAVRLIATKLNYKKNRLASSLRSGKSFVIGVIIPKIEINFFGSIVHGIESIANAHGYNILIYQSNESTEFEMKGLETFMTSQVDGIMASVAKETVDYSHYINVKNRGIPLVLFDRANSDCGIPSVVIDDFKGAFMATEHLIQQGYKRIAHVTGQQHVKIFNERLHGYKAALQKNMLPVIDELIFSGNVSVDSGREAVSYFMNLKEKPDAIFAVEDFTALGIIEECKEKGIKIPAEMGVFGFACEMFGEHITPSLSTIDQQTVLMGEKAIKLLFEIMHHRHNGSNDHSRMVIDPIPIFRNSSQRTFQDKIIQT
ncbi:MAG: LacI family DNA-binding transcriptional regulator [Ginsengibacter sp.]